MARESLRWGGWRNRTGRHPETRGDKTNCSAVLPWSLCALCPALLQNTPCASPLPRRQHSSSQAALLLPPRRSAAVRGSPVLVVPGDPAGVPAPGGDGALRSKATSQPASGWRGWRLVARCWSCLPTPSTRVGQLRGLFPTSGRRTSRLLSPCVPRQGSHPVCHRGRATVAAFAHHVGSGCGRDVLLSPGGSPFVWVRVVFVPRSVTTVAEQPSPAPCVMSRFESNCTSHC